MPYNILLADPPWPYDKQESVGARGGMAYPVLSMQDLCALNVSPLCAKDCALFLWATWPKMPQAFELIKSWGFKYRTVAFVWVKQNPSGKGIYSGMGHWTNGNTEVVLFAKRGAPKRVCKSVKQIIFAPRGRHSAKPPEARERIVKLMGELPRMELFARERAEGWDAIGDEIDGKDIREVLL